MQHDKNSSSKIDFHLSCVNVALMAVTTSEDVLILIRNHCCNSCDIIVFKTVVLAESGK